MSSGGYGGAINMTNKLIRTVLFHDAGDHRASYQDLPQT